MSSRANSLRNSASTSVSVVMELMVIFSQCYMASSRRRVWKKCILFSSVILLASCLKWLRSKCSNSLNLYLCPQKLGTRVWSNFVFVEDVWISRGISWIVVSNWLVSTDSVGVLIGPSYSSSL